MEAAAGCDQFTAVDGAYRLNHPDKADTLVDLVAYIIEVVFWRHWSGYVMKCILGRPEPTRWRRWKRKWRHQWRRLLRPVLLHRLERLQRLSAGQYRGQKHWAARLLWKLQTEATENQLKWTVGDTWLQKQRAVHSNTPWTKKTCHFVFDYNSCVTCSIFIIFVPVERAVSYTHLTLPTIYSV